MSLFPRGFVTPDPTTSFHPLFRLLDDFDQYSRGTDRPQHRTQLKSFTPRFDVKESAEGYELHGELPGIDQKDVEIEFTDAHTLSIKGRTERSYTSGTPPAGFVESSATKGAIESGEAKAETKEHQPTVEDEGEGATKGETAVAEKVAQEPKEKYWVSERSFGEFSRSFTFPARVDQDHVSASMTNGILNIVVPKAKTESRKKITIS